METVDDGYNYEDTSLSSHQYYCEETCWSFWFQRGWSWFWFQRAWSWSLLGENG
jgi:hypothetical protein